MKSESMIHSLISPMARFQSLRCDARVIWNLLKPTSRTGSHAQRLEQFYSGQANDYDEFRRRLLHGREALFEQLSFPDRGVWVDLGAGTGENLTRVGVDAERLAEMHWVDLSPSLLSVAQKRAADSPWADRIRLHEADATELSLPSGIADVVTLSYSLTMIPDWFAAIDSAERLLKPGGQIGIVDFFVSRKHPQLDEQRHGSFTRHFWPVWFGYDNVHPSPDHLPMLRRRFDTVRLTQSRGTVPYLPFIRAPYFIFIGTKPDTHQPLSHS